MLCRLVSNGGIKRHAVNLKACAEAPVVVYGKFWAKRFSSLPSPCPAVKRPVFTTYARRTGSSSSSGLLGFTKTLPSSLLGAASTMATRATGPGGEPDPVLVSNAVVPYTIKDGDTLSSIAAASKTTVDVLLQLNPGILTTPDTPVAAGTSIMVPAPEETDDKKGGGSGGRG